MEVDGTYKLSPRKYAARGEVKEGKLHLTKSGWDYVLTSAQWKHIEKLAPTIDHALRCGTSWKGSFPAVSFLGFKKKIEVTRGYVALTKGKKEPKFYLTRDEWWHLIGLAPHINETIGESKKRIM